MPAPAPQYGIGSEVTINGRTFRVVRYHRINKRWEVLLEDINTLKIISLMLKYLETA
jgi:hypothetical protein